MPGNEQVRSRSRLDSLTSLFEDIFLALNTYSRQPTKTTKITPSQTRLRQDGLSRKMPWIRLTTPVVRHRVRHQRLEVVGDRELLQVAREHQGRLLPPEDEDQPDQQRPLEPGADEREQAP